MVHPNNRKQVSENSDQDTVEQNFTKNDPDISYLRPHTYRNLDGFMIGRASFGNPWCFLPDNYEPTLGEILETMAEHGRLLWEWKNRKGMMEARKHLVQYLHGFPGVKEYRSSLVHVESVEDIQKVLDQIRHDHPTLLSERISNYNPESQMAVWDCGSD